MTESTIQSGALQTPLAAATIIRGGWQAARAADVLDEGDFDQAPVFSRSRLVGFALRTDLRANPRKRVRGVAHAIDQDLVLGDTAGIGALLPTLRDRRFAFIVSSEGISGFVTPSDLNKQAARAHFYLMIASLEIAASDVLRRVGPRADDLIAALSPAAQRTIRRRYAEDARVGVDVDYLVYMEFSQLLNAIGRDSAVLLALGVPNKREWQDTTLGLVRLRHDVMHPTRPLLGRTRSVADLIDAQVRLRTLLNAFAEVPRSPEQAMNRGRPQPDRSRSNEPSRRLKLHEAIELVLTEAGGPLPPREIARQINRRALYLRGDGASVPSGQVSARVHNYGRLFDHGPNGIYLRQRDSAP